MLGKISPPESATATSLEYYYNEGSTDVIKYYLNGSDLVRIQDDTTTTVMSGSHSLEFRYYPAASTRH